MSFNLRRETIGILLVSAVFAIALLGETTAAPEGSAQRESPGQASRSKSDAWESISVADHRRLREGTVINDVSGYFRQDGDGAIFVTDEGLEFGGLPNLNLERVARKLKGADESKSIRWSVSGTVTEFSGRNYLLIRRAVYKATAPPPLPEQLLN